MGYSGVFVIVNAEACVSFHTLMGRYLLHVCCYCSKLDTIWH